MALHRSPRPHINELREKIGQIRANSHPIAALGGKDGLMEARRRPPRLLSTDGRQPVTPAPSHASREFIIVRGSGPSSPYRSAPLTTSPSALPSGFDTDRHTNQGDSPVGRPRQECPAQPRTRLSCYCNSGGCRLYVPVTLVQLRKARHYRVGRPRGPPSLHQLSLPRSDDSTPRTYACHPIEVRRPLPQMQSRVGCGGSGALGAIDERGHLPRLHR